MNDDSRVWKYRTNLTFDHETTFVNGVVKVILLPDCTLEDWLDDNITVANLNWTFSRDPSTAPNRTLPRMLITRSENCSVKHNLNIIHETKWIGLNMAISPYKNLV